MPEEQRGRVSALTSVMTQIAPVIGIGLAYGVAFSTFLVFLVPVFNPRATPAHSCTPAA